jgi:inactivated superfamily I helicase
MRYWNWILLVALATLLGDSGAAAQSRLETHSQVFQNCLNGFSECNLQRLTGIERQAVQSAIADRNLRECLEGFGDCKESALTTEEKLTVARILRAHNLEDCADGIGECNEAALSASERREMAIAAHVRYWQAVSGESGSATGRS